MLIAFGWMALIFILICLVQRAPKIRFEDEPVKRKEPKPDMIERVNRIVAGAARDREQLEARAVEIVRLHGYSHGTDEADTLEEVVWNGVPYEEAIESVMKLRRNRQRRG